MQTFALMPARQLLVQHKRPIPVQPLPKQQHGRQTGLLCLAGCARRAARDLAYFHGKHLWRSRTHRTAAMCHA